MRQARSSHHHPLDSLRVIWINRSTPCRCVPPHRSLEPQVPRTSAYANAGDSDTWPDGNDMRQRWPGATGRPARRLPQLAGTSYSRPGAQGPGDCRYPSSNCHNGGVLIATSTAQIIASKTTSRMMCMTIPPWKSVSSANDAARQSLMQDQALHRRMLVSAT